MKTCACGKPLETNEQLRRGWCSEICQRLHQPRFHRNGVVSPLTPVPPATWRERPAVLRRNGKDNRN